MGRKKLTIAHVKKRTSIIAPDYVLLSTEYIGVHSKLKFLCPMGHKFWMTWGNFQQGKRCPECDISRKKTYSEVKEYIELFDYKLLSTEYINSDKKLKLQCPEGHVYETSYNKFQQGCRCPECAGNTKRIYSEVKKYIESYGYKPLSTEYINAHKKLKLQCDKGHIYNVTWNDFQQGNRCPECNRLSKIKNYTPEELSRLYNYQHACRNLTNKNYKEYKCIVNPKNLERGYYKYHLDHIFPVIEGFRRNIPIKYIANPYNLQMLWWKKNFIKHDDS